MATWATDLSHGKEEGADGASIFFTMSVWNVYYCMLRPTTVHFAEGEASPFFIIQERGRGGKFVRSHKGEESLSYPLKAHTARAYQESRQSSAQYFMGNDGLAEC